MYFNTHCMKAVFDLQCLPISSLIVGVSLGSALFFCCTGKEQASIRAVLIFSVCGVAPRCAITWQSLAAAGALPFVKRAVTLA